MINSLGTQIATGYLFRKTVKTIRDNTTNHKENKYNKYGSKTEENQKGTRRCQKRKKNNWRIKRVNKKRKLPIMTREDMRRGSMHF